MENWLENSEIDQLIAQLNPQLQTGKQYDANWEQLKRERKQKIDFDRTTKTQSPTLMDFDSHQGFVYRRYDGAHWHTELRNLDRDLTGLTPAQHTLKDLLDTLRVVTDLDVQTQWITPIKESKTFDPRYQLIHTGKEWWCVINDCVYAESRRRRRENRGYTEITFSTKLEPVFTQQSLNTALDKIFAKEKHRA